MSINSREYTYQDLCLDYGVEGHWKIPVGQIEKALVADLRMSSGWRIRDHSLWSLLPIVVCDEKKLAERIA